MYVGITEPIKKKIPKGTREKNQFSRLARVFRCYSLCETMKDIKEAGAFLR